MRLLTVIFILIFYFQTYSQWQNIKHLNIDYEVDASIESSILLNTKKYTNLEKIKSSTDLYPVSLYLSGCIYLTDNFAFEFKPGIVLGGEYYSGIEYGFYLRCYFMEQKYYASIGINIHNNIETSHGVITYVWATDETVTLLGIKVAYKPKTCFAFTLSYFYPLSDYPYYSISDYFGDSYITTLNHIVKVGFEFNF